MGAVHTHTREMLDYLDIAHADLRDTLATVPPERRGERPAPDRWSPNEVVEHLTLVETVITRMLADAAAVVRARGTSPGRDITGVLDRVDRARVADRGQRVHASERVQPRGGMDAAAAWSALERVHAELRELVLASDDLSLDHVVLPHPALGPLDFYGWIVFLGGHEMRHAAQIRESIIAAGAD